MLASCVFLLAGCKPKPTSGKIHNITLKLSGDDRLQRRFSAFMHFELDDIGITSNSSIPSDATIVASFMTEAGSQDHRIEVISQELRSGVQTKTVMNCPTISTGADEVPVNQDTFLQDATGAARDVRVAFPDATSLRLDPSSSYTLAPKFPDAFEKALPAQQLSISSDPQTALIDKITLLRVAAPTYGNLVSYKVNVVGTELSRFNESGHSGLQNATAPAFPAQCAKDWLNHEWSESSDPLYLLAHKIARNLAFANAAAK